MFAAAQNSTALQDTESFVGQVVATLSATDKQFTTIDTYMGTLYQSQRVRSHCSPETQTNRINKSGPYMFAAAENSTALQDTASFVGQSVTLLSATDKHFAFHNFAPGPRTDFISKLQDFALRSLDPLG